MATPDRSIFRQRALDHYMQRQDGHVVLRLVSPHMFLSLWLLLLLAVSGGVLTWTIQMPVMIQGKGLIVQRKAADGKTSREGSVLLLFPPDQRASLKVGQPVSVTIPSAGITFHSSIQTIEEGVMSPTEIGAQFDSQLPLAMTIVGPAVVAVAPVEPMSALRTYLGSQCQVQVQIGSRSVLSLVPGSGALSQLFHTLSALLRRL